VWNFDCLTAVCSQIWKKELLSQARQGSAIHGCCFVLKGKLPPTDSRLRPDQRHLENGEYDAANFEKLRLEQKQRRVSFAPILLLLGMLVGGLHVNLFWLAREHSGNWFEKLDVSGSERSRERLATTMVPEREGERHVWIRRGLLGSTRERKMGWLPRYFWPRVPREWPYRVKIRNRGGMTRGGMISRSLLHWQ
jgi:hypothetical protein